MNLVDKNKHSSRSLHALFSLFSDYFPIFVMAVESNLQCKKVVHLTRVFELFREQQRVRFNRFSTQNIDWKSLARSPVQRLSLIDRFLPFRDE